MTERFNTAILLIVFNRPTHTETVLQEIRNIKPKKLYVTGDGPRPNVSGEDNRVLKVRKLFNGIDWDCEIHTNYFDKNLGCKKAVSSGIDWFFKHEDQGIIIEDDCKPNNDFFWFCEELLERYKDNKKIWHIGGATMNSEPKSKYSYHFSAYSSIWGWATWRDRWEKYDVNLTSFEKGQIKTFQNQYNICKSFWKKRFTSIIKQKNDTWDFQWTYAIWKHNGLCISPNVNLVKNIGFDDSATRTTGRSLASSLKTFDLNLLKHPEKIQISNRKDWIKKQLYYSDSIIYFVINTKIFKYFNQLLK